MLSLDFVLSLIVGSLLAPEPSQSQRTSTYSARRHAVIAFHKYFGSWDYPLKIIEAVDRMIL